MNFDWQSVIGCFQDSKPSVGDAYRLNCLIESVPRWIDAEVEPPPGDGTRIFVPNDRGAFAVEWCEIDGMEFWFCQDGKHDDRPLRGSSPTHWMPIPTVFA